MGISTKFNSKRSFKFKYALIMDTDKNILGCFVSSGSAHFEDSQEIKDLALTKGALFRSYIYGVNKLVETIKFLNHIDYGEDLKLILFQFYVNPIPYLLEHLKPIENYRKNEKSIGIPIIVNDENFFSKSESGRYDFLRESILQKLDLLEEVVKKKKLDTNMELLKSDLKNIFKSI
jgi:hypothetical protein